MELRQHYYVPRQQPLTLGADRMKRMTRRDFNGLAATVLGVGLRFLRPVRANKAGVLLVSGQNNHDWERTTPMLKKILEEGGLFDVTVSLTPPKGAPQTDWGRWQPDFKAYDVVVSNYNGEMWPEAVRTRFEQYIGGGGTALVQHAANNPFAGWTAFEQMVGLLWRGSEGGYRVYLDDDGAVVRRPPGEGRGAGHGKLHDWQITARLADHPILKGLPDLWLHPHDELYHGQRGPAENMSILATAYSDPDHGGSGRHELMMWWIPYGQGKVLTLLPGHLWSGQDDDRALRCVGFRTLLQRGAEWLATGAVTLPVPDNFPSATQSRVLPG